jgi:hypothetical protein
MVVQAIALLDDLDKEINIYSMRVKVGPVCILVQMPGLIRPRNGTDGISRKWRK